MEPVSVVIPAYNEEGGVGAVVRDVRRLMEAEGIAGEILVVDDGSTDGTAQAALEAGARVLRHRSNHGYGAALKTGIAAARHSVVAILDADVTYPIEPLPEMLRRLERADMVVGARVGRNVHIPL
ncbi:MAG: glycosyltransferase family 2 protein, partial [Bryobacterales bacterium]|nr:glycosyltransferase family 2 protein [Bryobacterales bacterium]